MNFLHTLRGKAAIALTAAAAAGLVLHPLTAAAYGAVQRRLPSAGIEYVIRTDSVSLSEVAASMPESVPEKKEQPARAVITAAAASIAVNYPAKEEEQEAPEVRILSVELTETQAAERAAAAEAIAAEEEMTAQSEAAEQDAPDQAVPEEPADLSAASGPAPAENTAQAPAVPALPEGSAGDEVQPFRSTAAPVVPSVIDTDDLVEIPTPVVLDIMSDAEPIPEGQRADELEAAGSQSGEALAEQPAEAEGEASATPSEPAEDTAAEAEAAEPAAEEAAPAENAAPATVAEGAVTGDEFAVANVDDYVNIRAEAGTDSEVVGRLYNHSTGVVVSRADENGWMKIRSGNVEGYVLQQYLVFGTKAHEVAEESKTMVAVVTTETLRVRAAADIESDVITLVPGGDKLNIISEEDGWYKVETPDGDGYISMDFADVESEYKTAESREEAESKSYEERVAEEARAAATLAKIAAEDARKTAEELRLKAEEAANSAQAAQEAADAEQAAEEARAEAEKAVAEAEEMLKLAQEEAEKAEAKAAEAQAAAESATKTAEAANRAAGYTAPTGGSKGQQVADYALQFLGNPYVWGGTSLTNGADCSGFVLSVYAHFGVSLPHSDAGDRTQGTAVSSLAEARPGDIVCYDGHVGIYIGNGQIVHASNPRSGIKIGQANYRQILTIRRIFN